MHKCIGNNIEAYGTLIPGVAFTYLILKRTKTHKWAGTLTAKSTKHEFLGR